MKDDRPIYARMLMMILSSLLLGMTLSGCGDVSKLQQCPVAEDARHVHALTAETIVQVEIQWGFCKHLPSPPTVADGSVYLTKAEQGGHIIALDEQTGNSLWTYTRQADVLEEQPPVVEGGHVYASFAGPGGSGSLLCAVDRKKGIESWCRPFEHASAITAPFVADGTLFVATEESVIEEGEAHTFLSLIALDSMNGEERWHASIEMPEELYGGIDPIESHTLGSAVVLYQSFSRLIYVATYDGKVVAFDTASGEERWCFSYEVRRVDRNSTPRALLHDEQLSFSSPDNASFYALDAQTGKELWRLEDRRVSSETPFTIRGGLVYMVTATYPDRSNSNATIKALDVRTGQERWHLDTSFDSFSHLDVRAGEQFLYMVPDSSRLEISAYDLQTGQQVWNHQLEGNHFLIWPVLEKGLLFVGTEESGGLKDTRQKSWLCVLDAQTGKELHRLLDAEENYELRGLSIANDRLYLTGVHRGASSDAQLHVWGVEV